MDKVILFSKPIKLGIDITVNQKIYRVFTQYVSMREVVLGEIEKNETELILVFQDSLVPEESNSFVIKSGSMTEICYKEDIIKLDISRCELIKEILDSMNKNVLYWVVPPKYSVIEKYRPDELDKFFSQYEMEKQELIERIERIRNKFLLL